MAVIRPLGVLGVFTDGRSLFTRNLVPGQSWYGERLVRDGGVEYRTWDPYRSKLAALLVKGWRDLPLRADSRVLYLGAASGTTVSHVSDVCADGTVYAVEVSRRVFQKLLALAETRRNVFPVLADAAHPEVYSNSVGRVDVLYQDVAQRDQVGILRKNLPAVRPGGHVVLMVKARSIDVSRDPARVYADIVERLREEGLRETSSIDLDPFQRDHAAVLARVGRTK